MEIAPRPRIRPLSAEDISQIHSSKHITSLQGVILSLLENSLDAGSSKVEITVDWPRGACTVDDNGPGIPAGEFAENGGLCRMYCTSKRAPTGAMPNQSSEAHGSTGTFLAQLSAMAMLTITSTYVQGSDHASLTMHQGKIIARRLPGEHATLNQRRGTTVTVRDLFGNMPVRVKQRALSSSLSAEEEKSWIELKYGIVALVLAWPKPCAVRLRDADESSRVMSVSAQSSAFSSTLTKRNLDHLSAASTKYDLRDALPILVQSGLAPAASTSRWVPLAASTSGVSLKGLVCLDAVPSKQCQFIAIGISPCGLNGHNELYDVANKIFANSSFGTAEDKSLDRAEASPGKVGRRETREPRARKGIDRHPMFCLQLRFRDRVRSTEELDRLNEASLKAIVDVIEAAITAWLESHHFRPRKRRRRKDVQSLQSRQSEDSLRPSSAQPPESGQSPAHRRAMPNGASLESYERERMTRNNEPASALSRLSRIRSGDPRYHETRDSAVRQEKLDSEDTDRARNLEEHLEELRQENLDGTSRSWTDLRPMGPATTLERFSEEEACLHGEANGISSEDFGDFPSADAVTAVENLEAARDVSANAYAAVSEVVGDEALMTWTDPVSGQIYKVNPRTGVVLPPSAETQQSGNANSHELPSRNHAGIDTNLTSAGRPLSLARRKAQNEEEGSSTRKKTSQKWLPGFLKEWQNPVFAAQSEEPIPVASIDGPGLAEVDDDGTFCSRSNRDQTPNSGMKLSREALGHAKVIRQVDQKFILCKVPDIGSSKGNTLVLVDQHAASERVVLESLLQQLCNLTEEGSISIASTHLATGTTKARPVVFEVSAQEHDLFMRYRPHFTTWGFVFDLVTAASESAKPSHRLIVRSLPSVIAERCANFPALCIDLMRTEVWELADGTKRPITSLPDRASWLTLLPLLPAGLRDMLHSRSCRSAIMFNDALTVEECQRLMEQLSRCTFPFVCAHGRVSMVPLIELREGDGLGMENISKKGKGREGGNWSDREEICSAESLRRWIGSHELKNIQNEG